MLAVKGSSMEKWLCGGSLFISGVALICFLLDLILGIPYGGLSKSVDIVGILASGIVAYLSWDALKDLL
jgi:hypothetical protein